MTVNFKCPKCKRGNTLIHVQGNIIVSTPLRTLPTTSGEDFEYDDNPAEETCFDDAETLRFECMDCGEPIRDEIGDIITDTEVLAKHLGSPWNE